MSRPIYLLVYHSPIFAAHWALWIPSIPSSSSSGPQTFGKIINVQGSPHSGFTHEFQRNYSLSDETRSHTLRLLSSIDGNHIVDAASGDRELENVVDNTPIDDLERVALSVAAPEASLRRMEKGKDGTRTRVELKNCQTWLYEFVAKLVENEILSRDALAVLEQAPKN